MSVKIQDQRGKRSIGGPVAEKVAGVDGLSSDLPELGFPEVNGQGTPMRDSPTTIPIAIKWIARNQMLRTQFHRNTTPIRMATRPNTMKPT